MPKIGIRQLRDNLTSTIRRVRNGETFEVTHDGVPVAVLSPVPSDRVARLAAAGIIRPARKRRDRAFEPLPRSGAQTASEALEEDRSGR